MRTSDSLLNANPRQLVYKLKRAVRARDAEAAAAIIRQLNQHEIYWGEEVYERLHQVDGDLVLVLLDGLEPAAFGKLLSDYKHLNTYKIWDALEESTDLISAEALWSIKDHLGFPCPSSYPKLYAKLADSEDEKICEQLIQTIDRLAGAEAEEGTDLSAHDKTMSVFFLHWSPDDKGLGDFVRLLAARGDDRARAACGGYLMELPWGADRQATVALLEGMTATRASAYLDLFKLALVVHHKPAVLRTWLWAAIGKSDLFACLLGAIGDLAQADNNADRMTFIEYLDAALSQLNSQERMPDRGPIISAAEQVNTSAWSLIARGCYGTMLTTHLPEADVKRVSRRIDRAAIALTHAWETVRLDHMNPVLPLAVMLGMGLLVSWGLEMLLGEISRYRWLPLALFCGWLVWALAHTRTHFSGHETMGFKVFAGVVYFALLLAALATAVLLRID